jgi:hypothetical protein
MLVNLSKNLSTPRGRLLSCLVTLLIYITALIRRKLPLSFFLTRNIGLRYGPSQRSSVPLYILSFNISTSFLIKERGILKFGTYYSVCSTVLISYAGVTLG